MGVNMRRRITACLFILVLVMSSLPGCSKEGKGQDAKPADSPNKEQQADRTIGRYMEEKTDLPELSADERIVKIIENPNKQIEVYTITANKEVLEYKCYQLTDKNTWESSVPGWLNDSKINAGNSVLNGLCIGSNGTYYALYTNYEEESKNYIIKSEDGGNASQEIKLPYLNEAIKEVDNNSYYPSITKMEVLKNGNLVLHDMWDSNSLLVFSPEGEQMDKISINSEQQNYMVSDNDIILVNEAGTGIMFYDTEEKKAKRTVDYTMNKNSIAYTVKEDGTLLLGDSGGIHRLAKEGTLWETTVDGTLNSMSMPSLYFEGLFVKEGEPEEYYGAYSDSDEGYKLFHYVFDETVSSVPEKQITVYSLKENKTIRQAISLFQGKNSDVKVNYVVAMGEEEGNVSDYIRALNTELLAGNGADVLVLDGLPADSYIDKGVLSDISDVINPLVESGELLSNITDGYKKDGKVYRMPVRISIPVIIGEKDALASVTSLQGIVDYISRSDNTPFSVPDTFRNFLVNYLALYSGEFLQNGTLSEEKFAAFLENLKNIADNIGVAEYTEEIGSDLADDSAGSAILTVRTTDVIDLINEEVHISMDQVKNIETSLFLFKALEDNKFGYGSINGKYVPNGLVGLNSAGKEKEIAEQFIKFLFSTEVQGANLYDGFPVNNISLKAWMDKDDQGYGVAFGDDEGNYLEAGWPGKEDREGLYNLAKTLKEPIEINQILNEMITVQALPFFLGEIDAKQAASAVKTKVNAYLAE